LNGTTDTTTPSGSFSVMCTWPAIDGPAIRPWSWRASSA